YSCEQVLVVETALRGTDDTQRSEGSHDVFSTLLAKLEDLNWKRGAMNSWKVRFLFFLSLAIILRALLAGCGGGTVAYSQAPTAVVVPVPPVPPFVPAVFAGTFVVQAGLSQQFAATVLNDSANSGVTWSVGSSGCAPRCGTIDASGKYTAPMTPPDI